MTRLLKLPTRAIATVIAVVVAASLVACGSARRGEPFAREEPKPDARLALGEQQFDLNCSQCHPGGDAGLGPSLNDKPLPQFAIKLQVRHGVGAMPVFSKREISDEQLKAVTEYMVWLRRQRP